VVHHKNILIDSNTIFYVHIINDSHTTSIWHVKVDQLSISHLVGYHRHVYVTFYLMIFFLRPFTPVFFYIFFDKFPEFLEIIKA